MAVWLIARAGIRKKKGVAVSMGILIMLAAAMFDVGLTLLSGVKNFYDRENERLNGSHYIVRFIGNSYKDEYLDYFLKDGRVESAETVEAVMMNMASFPDGGVISPDFIPIDGMAPAEGYEITERTDTDDDMAVYVPAFFKDMGYRLDGSLTLEYNKQILEFRIAGFTRSTWFQSSVSSLVDIYVPQKTYERLFEMVGGGYLLRVRAKNQGDVEAIRQDFKENTDINIEAISLTSDVMDFSINEMRQGSTMVVSLLSAVLFIFSFLMVLVAVIVMRFHIRNHIEAQMSSLGAMSAIGYTGNQLRWSIAVEFLIISTIGTVLGTLVSYAVIAGLGGIIASSVGVPWTGGLHSITDAISALVIMGIVLLVSVKAAGRAAKIPPIEALRGGIKPHSFEKNYFPLERTAAKLPAALGIKYMMIQKKTYLMVGCIFTGVAFACGFAMITWWNMGKDDQLVRKLTGFEISDIMVYTAPHTDYDGLVSEIEAMDGVRKTNLYETGSAKVNGELLTCYLSDDYGKMEMVEVYEGSFPKYDNEIAITGVLAKAWGKAVGDTVSVQTEQGVAEYIISGLGQSMSNFGRQCYLNLDGMKRVFPFYKKHTISVYLEPGIVIEDFIGKMEERFEVLSPSGYLTKKHPKKDAARKAKEKMAALLASYGVDSAQYALMADGEIVLSGSTDSFVIERIENNRKLFVSNVDTIASSIGVMSAVILAGTFFMITLVLYMVIRSILVRQRTEFGIYKAMGYTDRQLMEMIASSFLPISAGGTLLGCILASMGVNRLASALFEQLGISNLKMAINPWMMAGMGMLIVAAAFAISMALARKIKGITVYGLLTEE